MSKTSCTEPRVHTHGNIATTIPVEVGEPEDSKNKEDRAKTHCVYRSGRSMEQAVEAPGQLSTASKPKARRTGQQEPKSLVPSVVPTKNCNPAKPTV